MANTRFKSLRTAFPGVLAATLVAGLFWLAEGPSADAAPASADEFVGLWKAKRRYGPDARGPLLIERAPGGWTADFLGRIYAARVRLPEVAFELPDGAGSFRGRLREDGRAIAGHWIPPDSVIHGTKYASPVVLRADSPDRWRGNVTPRDDDFTLFLMVRKRADGTVGAFLRNPERNIGVFYDVDRIEREGNAVRLIGKRLGQKSEGLLLSGAYDPENGLLALAFPARGGTYDFRRDDDAHSDFYPRGKTAPRYSYRPPPARDDDWPTGTLEEADIDRPAIEKFIQSLIDTPMESVHSPVVEGVLIARHGKLVLEEYFHGEHRDKLHETRSAAKSLTATLVGAVIHSGAPLKVSTPVYEIMNGGKFPAGLEPRKRAMTVEHLLTMSSGFYCDDADPRAPGNEENQFDQKDEPDYYRYTLRVPMASAPGEKAVYCSINANLALGVVSRATGESVLDTFDRLLGAPMNIHTYAWPLDPAGHPYGGGSVQFLPRDFMKLGQLMLNGGTWKGKRILGRDFVERASSQLYHLKNITYGYLWWTIEYPYKDRTLRAYFAGGNGGQGVMVIPELDLVIATYAGNYADRVGLHVQHDLTPCYILPAVREAGDDKNTPVVPRHFVTKYGPSPVFGPVRAGK
jgi:CubicO group peptidase (beta-lactamase class C family)